MKYSLFFTLVMCFTRVLFAQTSDSTQIDLGRFKFSKNLTISKSIKGTDLNKIPAINLREAIDVFFFGELNQTNAPTFVINGSVRNEITGYSIFDIEEITLVQSEFSNALYGNASSPILLVKTKSPENEKLSIYGDVKVAVNEFGNSNHTAVRNMTYKENDPDYFNKIRFTKFDYLRGKETTLFHQYFFKVSQKTAKSGFYLSANYLKDANPVFIIDTKRDLRLLEDSRPPKVGQMNFNATYNKRLIKNVMVNVNGSYAPQIYSIQTNTENRSSISKEFQERKLNLSQIGADLNYKSGIGIENTFQIGYRSSSSDWNKTRLSTNKGSNPSFFRTDTEFDSRYDIFSVRNYLSYKKNAGSFLVIPAIDINLECPVYKHSMGETRHINDGFSSRSSEYAIKTRAYNLTPQLQVGYKNRVNLKGGVVSNLQKLTPKNYEAKYFPYVGLDLEVVKTSKLSLILNGSYGKYRRLLNSLDQNFENYDGMPSDAVVNQAILNNIVSTNDSSFNQRQYGAQLAFGKFTLSFNIQHHTQGIVLQNDVRISDVGYNFYYPKPPVNEMLKRYQIDFSIKALRLKKVQWEPAFNINWIKNRFENTDLSQFVFPSGYLEKSPTTGGIINRFQFKSLSAGIDILFALDSEFYNSAPYTPGATPGSEDQVRIKNAFLSYLLSTKGRGQLECYLTTKNILNISGSRQLSYKKYYGIGLSAKLSR